MEPAEGIVLYTICNLSSYPHKSASERRTTLSKVAFFLLVLSLMCSIYSAQAQYPRCISGCTANDATIDPGSLYLVANTDCVLGQNTNAELYATFLINRDKGVCCVLTVFDIYINGLLVYNDYPYLVKADLTSSGTYTNIKIAEISWPCGASVELRDILVQWDPKGGQSCPSCTSDCSLYNAPSKCYYEAGPWSVKSYSISGIKFYDPDGNGYTTGDIPLSGWEIKLQKRVGSSWTDVATKTTGQDGSYVFDYLPPGTYRVCETVKDGWVQTDPTAGCYEVTITNANIQNINFGNRGNLKIKVCKFNDLDGDGVKDENEPMVPNWPISVTGPYGYSKSVSTGDDGCVELSNLPPGEYTVTEGTVPGWTPTTPTTYTFSLTPEKSLYQVDFGNLQCNVYISVT
ncbi:MAG: SpaA isopeptide-forming pilin-related protein, partial [Methanothrix sp.]